MANSTGAVVHNWAGMCCRIRGRSGSDCNTSVHAHSHHDTSGLTDNAADGDRPVAVPNEDDSVAGNACSHRGNAAHDDANRAYLRDTRNIVHSRPEPLRRSLLWARSKRMAEQHWQMLPLACQTQVQDTLPVRKMQASSSVSPKYSDFAFNVTNKDLAPAMWRVGGCGSSLFLPSGNSRVKAIRKVQRKCSELT